MDATIQNIECEIRELIISPGHDFKGHFGGPRGENRELTVKSVECVAGMGIVGDRYFGHKEDYKGQITFFDLAVFDAVREQFSMPDLSPAVFRRNVITSGVSLNDLIGKEFSIQGVLFSGSEECTPCFWMDEAVAPGTEDFLKGRGGLRARILSDGVLRRTR